VKVKLSNNTNVEGYISKAGEDSFEVTDKKTGTATTVAYQNVVRVKGNGLSIGSKIAIGVGIAGVAFAALVLAVVHSLS
jgi:alcohol dehydrogenase class IV